MAPSGRPPLHVAPVGAGADAQGPRLAGMAGAAQRLAGSYLASISSPNAATLAETPRFYGTQVRFHGHNMTTAALIAEKRRFFRRWPERLYAPQDGAMRTACDVGAATCTVRTVMGFRAANPARGARSLGRSELVLTVSFAGPRPVIVAESSRVLHRGAAALGIIPRSGSRFAEKNDAESESSERMSAKWPPVRRQNARLDKNVEPGTMATRSSTALSEADHGRSGGA